MRLECSDIGNLASVLFGLPDKRQDFAPEDEHLVKLRPARDNKLCHANALILQEALGEFLRRPQERHCRRAIIGHQPGPQVLVQPADIVRGGQGLLERLRIAVRENGALPAYRNLFVRAA